MESNFMEPVNIGSEEMVTINQLAQMVIDLSKKNVKIDNIYGNEFFNKYGFKCPLGVKGRKSDNKLFREKIGWEPSKLLIDGIKQTYIWIDKQLKIT
jgi:nucleoside-diphosphate-sugar epimerase